MPDAPTNTPWVSARPDELAPVLEDLGLSAARVETPDAAIEAAEALLVAVPAGSGAGLGPKVTELASVRLSESGALLLFLEGRRSETELAAWRNALWPLLHTSVHYAVDTQQVVRRTLSGKTDLEAGDRKAHRVRSGQVLVARRRVHSMSPDATVEKFDANASGWNGDPGGPGYPHFRWMRRYVGCFAKLAPGGSLLDFGCGAGWCGIEAAKRFRASSLRFFDPSPEMVRIATDNARRAGHADAEGRTGIGEAPPFPVAGEQPFDAVISSGVVSFSPDLDAWFAGLAATVKPGGTLVIGDIQRDSKGFVRRKREKALLPARELNAMTSAEARARLEALGFQYHGGAGYQLTRPFPEAMHVNETKLKGVLTYPLLWSNQLAAAGSRSLGVPGPTQFDSWVMHFTRPT